MRRAAVWGLRRVVLCEMGALYYGWAIGSIPWGLVLIATGVMGITWLETERFEQQQKGT